MALPDIEIEVTARDSASRTFVVTVPVERVRAAESETTKFYSRRVKLPGFRKGKAPEQLIRRRFGDAIRAAVIEELLRETWEKARSRESLKPVADPQVRNLRFEAGVPLTFEMHVDVKPEPRLERLGGFRLERATAPVTHEMVDGQLLALREQRAPWVPAAGRAKPGDLVEATIVNLAEGGEGEPVRFIVGQGRAIPELEAHIMALDPGATWEGSVRFPDDHPDEAKRGQVRHLRVTLREVKRQVLPELTDDFAREVGAFESLDALRAAVRSDLEAEARREAEARLRSALIDQIAAANNVAVPPSLLERALHASLHAYGVPEAEHTRFRQEFGALAEAQVRRDLVIEAVADAQGLHASERDVEARIAELAARRGESPDQVRAALAKAGRLRELERGITDERVFTYLLGLSTVEDTRLAR